MDEQTKKIIKNKLLGPWGAQPLTKDALSELRGEIAKKTGKNKYAPFANVKKWIKDVKKEIKQELKTAMKTEESTKTIFRELPRPPAPAIIAPSPSPIMDRVYLQTVSFEIAGIRKSMERISKQLDELEKQIASKGKARED
ncbi:MAG: hypothetical protein ABIH99_05565 [Candidatus Micrarchaeota archaeon]